VRDLATTSRYARVTARAENEITCRTGGERLALPGQDRRPEWEFGVRRTSTAVALAATLALGLAGCDANADPGGPAGPSASATTESSGPATVADPEGRLTFTAPAGWRVGEPAEAGVATIDLDSVGTIVILTAEAMPTSTAEHFTLGTELYCTATSGPIPLTFDGVSGAYARGTDCSEGYEATFAAGVIRSGTVFSIFAVAYDQDAVETALTSIADTWHWA
jgi:hypothetical protein